MTDAEQEEKMILGRLVAIQELRQETRRLESEGHVAPASDITIPAGWLHLLGKGLAWVTEKAEKEHSSGKLSDDECRECVEQASWLAMAIRDVKPGRAYSVRPDYHEALLAGLAHAVNLQKLEAYRVSEHDPLGLRFITHRSLAVLGKFFLTLSRNMD
jgi:hypothetical protein